MSEMADVVSLFATVETTVETTVDTRSDAEWWADQQAKLAARNAGDGLTSTERIMRDLRRVSETLDRAEALTALAMAEMSTHRPLAVERDAKVLQFRPVS